MELKIWANHAHVFPAGAKPGGEIERLKELMAACGIEKAVCFTCFRDQYERSGLPGDPVGWLAEAIRDDGSLIGFGTVDFDRDDIVYQTERIAGLGMRGIKIHPAAQEVGILSEKARQVYETAQEKRLFLSFHTGIHWHRISDYHPLLFDEVACDYPELKFSMEHIGGYHFFRDALAVMCNAKRNSEENTVFAGWTSVAMGEDGLPGEWSLTDDELRTVIRQTGNERSIFGLDFPYKGIEQAKAAIERILSLDIPEEAKAGVLGGNLRKALRME